MPTYAVRTLKLPQSASLWANGAGLLVLVVLAPVFGGLSDRIGRRPLLVGFAAAILVLAYPALWLLTAFPSAATLTAVLVVFAVLIAGFTGPAPAAMAELYPPQVRSTGLSIALQLCCHDLRGLRAIHCHGADRPDREPARPCVVRDIRRGRQPGGAPGRRFGFAQRMPRFTAVDEESPVIPSTRALSAGKFSAPSSDLNGSPFCLSTPPACGQDRSRRSLNLTTSCCSPAIRPRLQQASATTALRRSPSHGCRQASADPAPAIGNDFPGARAPANKLNGLSLSGIVSGMALCSLLWSVISSNQHHPTWALLHVPNNKDCFSSASPVHGLRPQDHFLKLFFFFSDTAIVYNHIFLMRYYF